MAGWAGLPGSFYVPIPPREELGAWADLLAGRGGFSSVGIIMPWILCPVVTQNDLGMVLMSHPRHPLPPTLTTILSLLSLLSLPLFPHCAYFLLQLYYAYSFELVASAPRPEAFWAYNLRRALGTWRTPFGPHHAVIRGMSLGMAVALRVPTAAIRAPA